MDFWDNTLSILAGVVLGFVLSIAAFPVQNWLRERRL
jgi:predicted PurR-regulated permease PerM